MVLLTKRLLKYVTIISIIFILSILCSKEKSFTYDWQAHNNEYNHPHILKAAYYSLDGSTRGRACWSNIDAHEGHGNCPAYLATAITNQTLMAMYSVFGGMCLSPIPAVKAAGVLICGDAGVCFMIAAVHQAIAAYFWEILSRLQWLRDAQVTVDRTDEYMQYSNFMFDNDYYMPDYADDVNEPVVVNRCASQSINSDFRIGNASDEGFRFNRFTFSELLKLVYMRGSALSDLHFRRWVDKKSIPMHLHMLQDFYEHNGYGAWIAIGKQTGLISDSGEYSIKGFIQKIASDGNYAFLYSVYRQHMFQNKQPGKYCNYEEKDEAKNDLGAQIAYRSAILTTRDAMRDWIRN